MPDQRSQPHPHLLAILGGADRERAQPGAAIAEQPLAHPYRGEVDVDEVVDEHDACSYANLPGAVLAGQSRRSHTVRSRPALQRSSLLGTVIIMSTGGRDLVCCAVADCSVALAGRGRQWT